VSGTKRAKVILSTASRIEAKQLHTQYQSKFTVASRVFPAKARFLFEINLSYRMFSHRWPLLTSQQSQIMLLLLTI